MSARNFLSIHDKTPHKKVPSIYCNTSKKREGGNSNCRKRNSGKQFHNAENIFKNKVACIRKGQSEIVVKEAEKRHHKSKPHKPRHGEKYEKIYRKRDK